MKNSSKIHVGIGGWNFAPWRGVFYPEGLPQAKELAEGLEPDDLPRVDTAHRPETKPHDVFTYFIHEGKIRAPAADMALIERVET